MPTVNAALSRPEALARLTAELTRYGSLAANWDDDGATAPLQKDVDAAVRFLAAYPDSLMLPKSCLSSAGDILLYWEKDRAHADLEFFDGEISLFLGGTMIQEEELLMDLGVEEMTASWIEDKLRFFKA